MPGPVITAKLLANVGGFNAAMKSAGNSLNAVGTQMLGVSKKAFALSAAIAAVGGVAVQQFAQFEKRMALVNVITGATASQFDQLEASAKNLGATTLFTARQAAEGMEILAKAGFSVNQILTATPEVLNLAAAANIELAEASDIVVGIMSGYGKTAEEVGKANDVLVKTFTSTNVTVSDLGETFKLAGPIAKTAGIEFEELSAAIGILGNAGIKGSLAGTALRKAILSFAAPTPKAQAQMKRLGLEVLDAEGNMRPLADILDVLGTERGPALLKALKDIIGIRPAAALAKLTEEGGDALRKLTEELRQSGGTAKKIADTQINTLSGQFTILKSKVESVSIEIGQRLAPVMRDVVKRVQGFVDGIRDLDENTKNTIIRIAAITAGVSALVGVFAAVAGAAAILAGSLLLLLPPIAVIALLIALGGALKIAWEKNLGGIQEAFANLKVFIGQFFDDVSRGVAEAVDFWSKQVKKFADFMQKPVEVTIPFEITGDPAAMDVVKALVTQGFRGKNLDSAIKAALKLDATAFDKVVTRQIKPFSELADAIKVLEKARPDLFGGKGSADDFATGFAANLKDVLKPAEIAGALKESFMAGLKGLKDLVPPEIQAKIKAVAKELEALLGKIGQGTGKVDKDLAALLAQGRQITVVYEGTTKQGENFIDSLKNMGAAFMELGKTIKNVALPQVKSAITGLAGQVLKGAETGAKVGGPKGAIVGAITALVLASKTFKDIIALVNQHLALVANLLGAFLDPLKPLIAIVLLFARALLTSSAIFNTLGIAMQLLTPVFKLLFEVFKVLGIVVLKVARFFFKLLGKSTSNIDKQLKELEETTFETAGNVEDLGDAANAAAEALFNVPEGFKVASARFRAQDAERGGGGGTGDGGFPGGGGGGPGGGGLGGVKGKSGFPGAEIEGAEGPIGTSGGALEAEDRTLVINVTTDDPVGFVDKVEEEMDRRGFARRGVPGARSIGPFSTRRGST